MPKKAKKKRAPVKRGRIKEADPWTVLMQLIQAYADAQEADSWKGGGDPSEMEAIELRFKLARAELNGHFERMRRSFE